eukprot:EG_transcript_4196
MGNEMALLPHEDHRDASVQGMMVMQVEQAINMPADHISVEVTIQRTKRSFIAQCDDKHSINPTFSDHLRMGPLYPEDILEFKVYTKSFKGSKELGWTDWRVRDFIRRPERTFPLNDDNGYLLLGEDRELSFLKVTPILEGWPPKCPRPMAEADLRCPKHAMLITRGTRGDVQPFVALALGLIKELGWRVTLCTELRYKETIQRSFTKVPRDQFRFRPSGGDTSKKIEGTVSKKAMNSKSELMQAMMLSRSEAEFFRSESAVFHWAKTMRPDVIVYGFTLANIAMIASEALQIPIIGFLLQPTVVPSNAYSPVTSLKDPKSGIGKKVSSLKTSHETLEKLRTLMEATPFDPNALNKMRHNRGLQKIPPGSSWKVLISQNAPIVVPINEECFGGKPDDWPPSAEFTNFIFLREDNHLSQEYRDFINRARENKTPLVLMAFSSMPVSREDILELACLMVQKCQPTPAVVAMVGNRPLEDLGSSLQGRVDGYKEQGLLFEGKAAPFELLLPEMDCNIVHGGLGTTAEALLAGKPILITGILLMDQRFWGHRIQDLGVGPMCCHITEFEKHCVEWVSTALQPGSPWSVRAAELARQLPKDDGIRLNIEAFQKALAQARPIQPHHDSIDTDSSGHSPLSDPRAASSPPASPAERGGRRSSFTNMSAELVEKVKHIIPSHVHSREDPNQPGGLVTPPRSPLRRFLHT